MANRDSRNWLIPRLLEMPSINEAAKSGDVFVIILSKKGQRLVAAVVDQKTVKIEHIVDLLSDSARPDFVVAIPKSTIWTGDAIEFIRDQGLGWGGMGELLRAVDADDIPKIQKKEYDFVERGLLQHDRVSSLKRLFDRVYQVNRHGLDSITVVLVNEYELTGENIRHARSQYGDFDAVLKTNPSGRITDSAREVAGQLSVGVFLWGEFLSRLNRP